jgi:hypothetical protein
MSRLARSAALALALAALAVPTAAAQQQDLRTPDARDAARPAQASPDLRTPDARDAARLAQSSPDLRTPDARDAATRPGASSAPDVTVVKVPAPERPAGGIDWGDAGIAAGAALGLILLALGGTVAIAHRRRGARSAVTP